MHFLCPYVTYNYSYLLLTDSFKISYMSVNDEFLEVYFNLLDDKLRGPWLKITDEMYRGANKLPSKKGYARIQDELLLGRPK